MRITPGRALRRPRRTSENQNNLSATCRLMMRRCRASAAVNRTVTWRISQTGSYPADDLRISPPRWGKLPERARRLLRAESEGAGIGVKIRTKGPGRRADPKRGGPLGARPSTSTTSVTSGAPAGLAEVPPGQECHGIEPSAAGTGSRRDLPIWTRAHYPSYTNGSESASSDRRGAPRSRGEAISSYFEGHSIPTSGSSNAKPPSVSRS
jgi:hypothetical protein